MSQLRQSTTPDKPLPVIPQPFKPILSLSPGAEAEDEDEVTALLPSADSSDQVCAAATSDTTKREYALLELLDSERTYASDLILIRDYQIPLASGRLSSISSVWLASDSENTIRRYPGLGPPTSDTPATPPGSCAVASRPLTTASDVSALSLDSIFTLRPMKTKDVNIVFGNIEELAAFSEKFLDQLESALGKLIEDSDGEDYVGRFFLDFIPQMEPLYRTYIMNQTHALEHYHRLSETFQFDVYFPRSQILAHKSSNAWDLPSLLIKPVQRLLNYPQLLAAIIAETPDSHHDKANLIVAHAQIGALARDLNARWRQQKVVREVLASAGVIDTLQTGGDAANAKKKGGLAVGLAASVGGLGRVMNLRSAAPKANAEAERAVMAMGERLKSYEPFMMQFTREAVDWADAMLAMVGALDEWAQSFGRMIWTDPDEEHSDMFKAFLALIRDQLLPLCGELEVVIKEDLFRTVASLMKTMVAPMCLLEAMETLEPLHYSSVGRNVEASESYMALRAQLCADLPTYFTLLDKGIAACILKFAHIQRTFYSTVRDRWAQLWDGVRVEVDGEANQGAAETFRAWWNRFTDVDEQLTRLSIARRLGEKPTTVKRRTEPGERYTNGEQATSSAGLASILAAIEQSRVPPRRAIRPPYYSPPPFGHPAFTGTRPGSVHSMYWTEREDRHSSLSDTMQEDGPGQWSRRPSSSQRLTDSPSPNLYKFTKIETSDSIRDVIQPREDVISMEEVAKSRRRVQFDVQPRIIPMPTDSDDDDGEEAATDSDDTGRNMAFSYWGADKVMLQKPIVKPKAPLASSSRRAVTPMTAYARESAVNAKFGTRLVHVAPRRAPRPRQGVISMEEVAKSRQQVQPSVQPRNAPMPTEDSDEEAATDSDDSGRNIMTFSYWGADKVTVQKPIVKPKAPLASSSRRAVPPMMAYARESAVNAKFGTRLVHGAPRRAPRPRQGVISMGEVAKSRQQVQPTVQPRNVLTPIDEEEVANDSDDSDRTGGMSSSYWDADTEATLQKPIVKPKAPLANGSRRAITPTRVYARESSTNANAKFGTRLVHGPPHQAPRPASRRTVATPVNRKEGPPWDSSSCATTNPLPNKRTPRNVSKTSVATSVITTPNTNSKTLASPAPSDSEDSGVGLYRMMINQDPSLNDLIP